MSKSNIVKMPSGPTERDKPLPANFSKGRKFHNFCFWKPTWRERFMMVIGYNVVLNYFAFTEHNPGKVAIDVRPILTPFDHETLVKDPTLMEIPPVEPNPGMPIIERKR